MTVSEGFFFFLGAFPCSFIGEIFFCVFFCLTFYVRLYELNKIATSPGLGEVALCRSDLCVGRVGRAVPTEPGVPACWAGQLWAGGGCLC